MIDENDDWIFNSINLRAEITLEIERQLKADIIRVYTGVNEILDDPPGIEYANRDGDTQ